LLALWWRRRRRAVERTIAEKKYREDLEHDVAARTVELRSTNDRLSHEIVERQQAEERLNAMQADLVQANKLAQLGQITAGVAHEINQPLAAIRVLAENCMALLQRGLGKSQTETVGQNLTSIVRLNNRIGHITGELRTFSRKATGQAEPVSLKDALSSALLLNRSRTRTNKVRLSREAIDGQILVIGGRIRLEQALVNLLQNAYEALEEIDHPEVRISATIDNNWVLLKISDNGPGIPPQVLSQIFTPFVTTKETGLDLGLVITHDIIRDLGGELTAENGPVGATFTLKLRRVAT
jgi:two-component system C4-dicarboxylate transport sensor histidine kinase DctB